MPVELRPLGVGEIFDRAVTLYVRNFVLFTIIAAFAIVPATIVRYFLAAEQVGNWTAILDQIQHPGKSHAAAAAGGFSPWFFAVLAVTIVLSPFMYVAIAAAIGRIYKGETPEWGEAYRVALRHTGGIIGLVVAFVLVFVGGVFAGSVGLGLLMVIAVLLFHAVAVLGVIVSIVTAIYAIAFILAMLLCYLVFAIAYDALAIEDLPFLRAIGASFARVFNRGAIGKAVLMVLAFGALQIVVAIISLAVASLGEAVMRQALLESIVQGVFSLVLSGFIGVLAGVYYFDVRIRSEGLDLQAEIDRLEAQPQA